jgi:hypothetical protein
MKNMDKRPTGGKTQDEANVHILDYVNTHGDDRLGVYYDIGNKIEREVHFLTEVVAKGKIDSDPDIKEKVYDTSVALRKLKKFCSSRPEFSKFNDCFNEADALLNDSDFDNKGYKAEMERGHIDGDTEYTDLEKQIAKAAASKPSAQPPGQATEQIKDDAQSQKVQPKKSSGTGRVSYTSAQKSINDVYEIAMKDLGSGDENDSIYAGKLLAIYESQLEQYQGIDEGRLGHKDRAQRSIDIMKTQRKIDEIKGKIADHNKNLIDTDFAKLKRDHDTRIHQTIPKRRKKRREVAKTITACMEEVNQFEKKWAETITPTQRNEAKLYRSQLKGRRISAAKRSRFACIIS